MKNYFAMDEKQIMKAMEQWQWQWQWCPPAGALLVMPCG